MIDFLIYSMQTIVLQLGFLFIFEIFFKKETFFKANRFYLLGSLILSLLTPLINIPLLKNGQNQTLLQLKEIVVSNANFIENKSESTSYFSSISVLYGIGILVFLTLFLIKLFKIYQVKQNTLIEVIDKVEVYRIKNSNQAFSFFNYIFIGNNNANIETIVKHEAVHKKQLHSLDLVILEMLKIIFWFNPIVYFYRKRIVEIHEFEADSASITENKSSYYETLICQIFEVNSISLANNFYNQSLIKKRLVMLQKSKSKKAGMMKYLVVIPMTALSLMLFSTTAIAQETKSKIAQEKDEIPFAEMEEIPQFEGCSYSKGEEAKECFMNAMNKHISTNFKYPKVALDNNNEGRVVAIFIIDTNGNVSIEKVKGPEKGKLLEEETIRIIKLLPKFKPGIYKGKAVKVRYAQPIVFRLPPPPPTK
jgi:bla regulator protein BlaR1